MKKEKFNWAIMGLGNIAHKMAEALPDVEGANMYAVASRSIDKATLFASKHGFEKAYGSYDELVSDSNVDIIYISTPHSHHCSNAILCLENKKAVICEKPLAVNQEQVRMMVEASIKHDTFLMEALWTRFLPSILKVEEIISSGRIGEVRMVRGNFAFKGNPDPKWRLMNPVYAGGSLLDVGIYPVFLTLLLLGEPEEVQAVAQFGKTGVEESISISMGYENGQVASVFSSVVAESSTDAEIIGTEGRILIHRKFFTPTTISLAFGDTIEAVEVDYKGNGFNYEAAEVQRCLADGKRESAMWSRKMSLKLISVLDKIRSKAGITFPDLE